MRFPQPPSRFIGIRVRLVLLVVSIASALT